ncbi:MAG: SET domain-containing protein [Patescibacteria group bacterium]|nr:SET domain-containing protein [Patescibacteria group bacterium]
MKKKKLKLKVGRSRGGAGLGLFATEPIKRGQFVIEYTGEKISSEEADKRGGKYLFDVSKDLVLDAKDRKHLARYINHSCKPNCYAERDVEEGRVSIYARRKIEPGEELSYNYGKDYWEGYIGAKNCRCEKCAN